MIEVEQKFRVEKVDKVAQRLDQLGADRQPAIRQVDTYFAHPSRDFAQTDEALRLRQVGESNVITYKGPKLDLETKTRQEIELPLGDGTFSHNAWAELLAAVGFGQVLKVAKLRTPYHLLADGLAVEVVIDVVDGLGTFVEVEAAAEEATCNAARSVVASVAGQLGLTASERRSYLELLLDITE